MSVEAFLEAFMKTQHWTDARLIVVAGHVYEKKKYIRSTQAVNGKELA